MGCKDSQINSFRTETGQINQRENAIIKSEESTDLGSIQWKYFAWYRKMFGSNFEHRLIDLITSNRIKYWQSDNESVTNFQEKFRIQW